MDDDETTTPVEGFRQSIGQASFEVMDMMDEAVVKAVQKLDKHTRKLCQLLMDRGADGEHAVQIAVSFAAGAAFTQCQE